MTDTHFSRRFTDLLVEAGAPPTVQRLGPWLGVSATMAWNYRTGTKLPAMENATYIARKLNCCVEYLLTGRGPKRPPPANISAIDKFLQLTPRNQTVVELLIDSLLAGQMDDAALKERTDGRTDGAINVPPKRDA